MRGLLLLHRKVSPGVRLTDVMRAIRNLAVKNGYVHPFFRMQVNVIAKFGRIFEAKERTHKRRARLGLPSLPPVDPKEVSTILGYTDIKTILTAKKEGT